jgi:hypothetical protein
MGNGQWAMGNGLFEEGKRVKGKNYYQCPMPHDAAMPQGRGPPFSCRRPRRTGSPLRIDGTGNRARGLTARN